jgi:hypothetical protein
MTDSFYLGTWLGRRQGFQALSGQALASDACCLRYIRDNRLYRTKSENWPDFCDQYLGVNRSQIDRLIQCLDEFGDPYFNLSQLIRISPQTYRALLPHMTPEGLEHNGEIIPIAFDYVPRLNAAINAIRPRKQARQTVVVADTFENIAVQLRDCADRLAALPGLTPPQQVQLAALLDLFRAL